MKQRKIPTVLGVFLVIIMLAGLFVATRGVGDLDNLRLLFTQADETKKPANITLSNITGSSFTVSWTTESPSGGAVFYGNTPDLKGGIAVDERDAGQSDDLFTTHLVRVNRLEPNTTYYFKLGETSASYGNPEADNAAFEVTTGPNLSSTANLSPVSGKAFLANGQALVGGIVIWQSPGASKLSTLTKDDGSYTLSLNQARTTNLTSAFEPGVNVQEMVVISGGTNQEAVINCVVGTVSTFPSIRIGQTMDCTDENANQSASQSGMAAFSEETDDVIEDLETGFGSFGNLSTGTSGTITENTDTINIQAGETVSTGMPTFSGKVEPQQVIKIVVHSDDVYSGTVIAKSDGSWSWTPPASLTPGEHTVTITIVNSDGTTQTVERTFYVTAGEPIMPITSGTSSGTISPTPITTPTPLPTDVLLESGVDGPTITVLLISLSFIILSIGAISFF